MTIAYINENSFYINKLEQRNLISLLLNETVNEDVIFVKNENIFADFDFLKKHKRIIIASLFCLDDDFYQLKKILKTLCERDIELISVKEKISLTSKEEIKNFLKGFETALLLKELYLSEKIKNGLNKKKKMGFKIGRVIGSKNKKKSLCEKNHQYIFEALQKKERIIEIANKVGVSARTLFNYKKAHFS